MTKMLYSNPDETVYISLYRNRWVAVSHETWDTPIDWWCGYAEVLPEDGIDLSDEQGSFPNFDYPGDWSLSAEHFESLPPDSRGQQRLFLGFNTDSPKLADYDLQKTMGAACELVDQIIEYGKRQRAKRGAS